MSNYFKDKSALKLNIGSVLLGIQPNQWNSTE